MDQHEYHYELTNGKTLVLEGDTQPSDADVEEAAKGAGVQLKASDEFTAAAKTRNAHLAAVSAKPTAEESVPAWRRNLSAFFTDTPNPNKAIAMIPDAGAAFPRIASGVRDVAGVLADAAPHGTQLVRGINKITSGVGTLATPALGAGLVLAPATTLGGLLAGGTSQYAVRKGAEMTGANPDVAEMAGNVAGVGGGLAGAKTGAAVGSMLNRNNVAGGIMLGVKTAKALSSPIKTAETVAEWLSPATKAANAAAESTPEAATPKMSDVMKPPVENNGGALVKKPAVMLAPTAEQPGVELPPNGDLPDLVQPIKAPNVMSKDDAGEPLPSLGRAYRAITGPTEPAVTAPSNPALTVPGRSLESPDFRNSMLAQLMDKLQQAQNPTAAEAGPDLPWKFRGTPAKAPAAPVAASEPAPALVRSPANEAALAELQQPPAPYVPADEPAPLPTGDVREPPVAARPPLDDASQAILEQLLQRERISNPQAEELMNMLGTEDPAVVAAKTAARLAESRRQSAAKKAAKGKRK